MALVVVLHTNVSSNTHAYQQNLQMRGHLDNLLLIFTNPRYFKFTYATAPGKKLIMADQFSNLYFVFTLLLIQLLVDRLLYAGFSLREWEDISDAVPVLVTRVSARQSLLASTCIEL